MITVAIVSILGLGIASAFTFGATQFALLQEENMAQTNVQQAAFLLRLFMTNAVKVQCAATPSGALLDPNPLTGNPVTGFIPGGVLDGTIDCRALGTPNAVGTAGNPWLSTQASALGIFYRENYAFNVPTSATSNYQAVGVYYQAPDGSDNNMGNLIFSTPGAGVAGGSVSSTAGTTIIIDHISNIQILGFATTPVLNTTTGLTFNMLQTITYQITARYMSTQGFRDYSPAYTTTGVQNAGYAMVNDVVQQVQVSFIDNYLGPDLSSPATPTSQRLNGGIYYYKFMAPAAYGF
jgi:hypothetical protein